MRDLHKALADIDAIKRQVARGTQFRGYGPVTIAFTGLLSLLAAAAQALWLDDPREQLTEYLTIWIGMATLSVALIGTEIITRSRRLHSGLADAMIHHADRAVPSGRRRRRAARLRADAVRAGDAVDAAGPLADPGQPRDFRLGSARCRARVALAGAWYFVAGLVVLMLASADPHALAVGHGPAVRRRPTAAGGASSILASENVDDED